MSTPRADRDGTPSEQARFRAGWTTRKERIAAGQADDRTAECGTCHHCSITRWRCLRWGFRSLRTAACPAYRQAAVHLVRVGHDSWLAALTGDPGRTIIRDSANRYPSAALAIVALLKAKHAYPNRSYRVEAL